MSIRNLFLGKISLPHLLQFRPLSNYNHIKVYPRQYSTVMCKKSFIVGSERETCALPPRIQVQCRCASDTTVKDLKPKTKEQERLDKAKSKQAEPPPIVLIDEKEKISVVSLEDAGKLAKKRGLFLVEWEGHGMKSGKQAYKLVSKSQFYGEDWKTKKEGDDPKGKKTKEEKTVLLKSKTSEHDIAIKTKNILKLVEKGHTVRILIGQVGDQNQNPEPVFKIMENLLKDEPVRIIQKIVKNSQIRFQVMPPKATDAKPNAAKNTKDKEKNESDSDEP